MRIQINRTIATRDNEWHLHVDAHTNVIAWAKYRLGIGRNDYFFGAPLAPAIGFSASFRPTWLNNNFQRLIWGHHEN